VLKNLIAIPQGALMRVAASKSITTLSALKEKSGVDRKTLRLINAGKPVKRTTIQRIADRLRIPIAHFLGPDAIDKSEIVLDTGDRFPEIKLRQLDAGALRKLAGEYGDINWLLQVDKISEEQETLLLNLRENLRGWHHQALGIEDPDEERDNLCDQISRIKKSVGIDTCVEELAKHNLRIFGGTYIVWKKNHSYDERKHRHLPFLKYRSRQMLVLSIAPGEKDNSTVRVCTGEEPPQHFVEEELTGIDFVYVDRDLVWSRTNFGVEEDEDIPF
jgi:hypothetical protein